MFDYLVVGSGVYGATFARQMTDAGKKVLVIDKNSHVAGNCHTELQEGILVHKFGPHAFHTNSLRVWNFLNRFTEFNHYRHKVLVRSNQRMFSFPINLMTFHQVWGITTPEEAQIKLAQVCIPCEHPTNLEDWCLSQVGEELYHLLIRDYTFKQWQRDPRELPASIIKRIPIRLTYDDNYFDNLYQGIPIEGYTKMVENMLAGIQVELNLDFFAIDDWRNLAKKLVYTGPIDRLFDYEFGHLEYRTLQFRHETLEGDFQGISQVNYSDSQISWTRTIEHKHFQFFKSPQTVVTWETPQKWEIGAEPYYPINDETNNRLYQKYKRKLDSHPSIIGGGRLCLYKYLDMDTVISIALDRSKREIEEIT